MIKENVSHGSLRRKKIMMILMNMQKMMMRMLRKLMRSPPLSLPPVANWPSSGTTLTIVVIGPSLSAMHISPRLSSTKKHLDFQTPAMI